MRWARCFLLSGVAERETRGRRVRFVRTGPRPGLRSVKILGVTEEPAIAVVATPGAVPTGREAWSEFWHTPPLLRAYLLACAAAAVVLAGLVVDAGAVDDHRPAWLTAAALVLVSVVNVEIGRALAGGVSQAHQPHKALSAWAFSCALLLPAPWLLVVVPVTYAHARWRGIRLPLWKWIGSGVFLVLAGAVAAEIRHQVFDTANWMAGDGGKGLACLLLAGAGFLATETALFFGPAYLNRPEDEVWLRRTLSSRSYYSTEIAVLLIGGLLAAVWTGGPWFILLFLPIYALAQRAALHDPLRAQADTAEELASENQELELANQFKIDLIGMLGHEIGNPLTAIAGFAQVGSDALHDGDVRRAQAALVIVERNADRIRLVLHEILAMVSSENNALTAHREECLLEPHLRSAAAGWTGAPTVTCEPGLTVLAQPGHLDQILVNLLSNADKYAGGATRIAASTTPDGVVGIEVEDAGPGVPAAFQTSLFQRFSRDLETAGTVVGTGLGLFITRELARANGGDVSHRPATPTGSVFVVTLPRPAAADVPEGMLG